MSLKQQFKEIFRSETDFYLLAIIYGLFASLLTIGLPISVQTLVSSISMGVLLQPLVVISLILLSILFFFGLLKILQIFVIEIFQRRFFSRISLTIAHKVIHATKSSLAGLGGQRLVNRYFDIMIAQKNMSLLIVDGITMLLQLIVGMLLLALYHPYFLIFDIILIALLFFIWTLTGPSAIVTAKNESKAKYRVAAWLQDLALPDNHQNNSQAAQKTLAESAEQIQDFLNNRRTHFQKIFTQSISFFTIYALLTAMLLGLGGYLVIIGELTIGQLVASELVAAVMLSNLSKAGKYLESFYDLMASTHKISQFFDLINDKSLPTHNTNIESFGVVRQFRVNHWLRSIRRILVVSLCSLSMALYVVPWQQTSKGEGQMTAFFPDDRVQDIQSPIGGRISRWYVQDGSRVKKGEPIVDVIDVDPNYINRLRLERDAAIKKFESIKTARETAVLNYERQKKLFNKGLSARTQLEKAKIEYQKLIATEASAAAALAKAEVRVSRQETQSIVAPRDGTILRLVHGAGAVLIKKGQTIATFVPDSQEMAAEIFIDGNDLPLIYPGRDVRLQFEGWPAVQFSGWPSVAVGTFGGKVAVVDPSASSNGKFRVLIKPSEGEKWPDQKYLRQGTRVHGWVLLNNVRAGYEIWRQINRFPPALNSAPTKTQSEKSKE